MGPLGERERETMRMFHTYRTHRFMSWACSRAGARVATPAGIRASCSATAASRGRSHVSEKVEGAAKCVTTGKARNVLRRPAVYPRRENSFLVWTFALAVGTIPAGAIAQTFQWARLGGGIGFDQGEAIAVDAAGNSYVTGLFFETATFGPFTLTSAGSGDVFVVKYDPSGTVLWVSSTWLCAVHASYHRDRRSTRSRWAGKSRSAASLLQSFHRSIRGAVVRPILRHRTFCERSGVGRRVTRWLQRTMHIYCRGNEDECHRNTGDVIYPLTIRVRKD